MEAQFPIEMDRFSKFPIMNGPETPFLKVPLTFRARIGVLCLPYICNFKVSLILKMIQ